MKTLAIATQKGGEGKTTLAVHLAYAAADKDLRVLYVDLDTQGSSTLVFTGDSRFAHEADYEYLAASELFYTDESPKKRPAEVARNIDLIAPDRELQNEVMGFTEINDMKNMAPKWVLSHFKDDYDICIIDAPPALGRVLIGLLTASDYVISPITMDIFAIDGTAELLQTISEVRQINPDIKHLGIVPNKINTRSKTELASLKSLREAYGALVTPYDFSLRFAVKMAIAMRKPVWSGVKGSSHRLAANEWKENCNLILSLI